MEQTYLDIPEFQDVKTNVLFHYLDIKSLMYIAPSCFDKWLINRIEHRLKCTFQDHYEEFRNILSENNLAISGSLIIQCILDEYWESDIDIVSIGNLTSGYGGSRIDSEVSKFLCSIETKINANNETYNYLNSFDVSNIETYNVNGTDIQIIHYGYDKIFPRTEHPQESKDEFIFMMWRNILDNYDFNVCKNIYYIEGGISKVKIGSLDDIINKKIIIGKTNVYSREKRIRKYTSRGFTFDREILNELPEKYIEAGNNKRVLIIDNKDELEKYGHLENDIYYVIIEFQYKLIYKNETGSVRNFRTLRGNTSYTEYVLLVNKK